MRHGRNIVRMIGTVATGVALATTGAVAVAAPAHAAPTAAAANPGCYLGYLAPNGGVAWCASSSGTAFQVLIRCVTPNSSVYYRTGPWRNPGGGDSRVYCDTTADNVTDVWLNLPD